MNDDACPCCGLHYGRLRTGLSFACVRAMLWTADPDPITWRYKTRRVVLGYWRQIKLAMWRDHIAECIYHHDQAA